VTLQSGSIDFGEYTHGDGYIQVNTYHIDSHYRGKAKAFLTELLAAMKGPDYFNNDDAMTDYFHRSHYTDINVGRWNKPYFLQNTAKKASKKPVQASKNVIVTAKASISDAAEGVARMTAKEQDKFVEDIVTRYPNLADSLMTKLGFGLMATEGE
jgi:murein L,D-transpeptidase YafK